MSSESDIAKYVELLNDRHVNQLNFPGDNETYQFNIEHLQYGKNIFTNYNTSVEQFLFCPLKNFPLAAKILPIRRNQGKIDEDQLKELIKEVNIFRKIFHGPN